ncbi:hypothetical protein B0O80DRAFT_495406 [Mortierella sp. GBAus27b]|nr:hypothetical protein B0O80DRAFT_495406 [Mortierella sp. GBAus27b]
MKTAPGRAIGYNNTENTGHSYPGPGFNRIQGKTQPSLQAHGKPSQGHLNPSGQEPSNPPGSLGPFHPQVQYYCMATTSSNSIAWVSPFHARLIESLPYQSTPRKFFGLQSVGILSTRPLTNKTNAHHTGWYQQERISQYQSRSSCELELEAFT